MLSGDDFVTLPVAGLGIVPLLIEVAAGFESGTLDPLEIIERSSVEPVAVAGVWQHLKAPALPLCDLAVLAASTGDALAANALLARVGLEAVRARIEQLGLDALGPARSLPRRARSRRRAALRARLGARARRTCSPRS